MTKSHAATPGVFVRHVNTVKIEGSFQEQRSSTQKQISRQSWNEEKHSGSLYHVIVGYCVDCIEESKVVFARCIVAMPRHHVKRRVGLAIVTDVSIDRGWKGVPHYLSVTPQAAIKFVDNCKLDIAVFVVCHRCLEISWVGQAISSCKRPVLSFYQG